MNKILSCPELFVITKFDYNYLFLIKYRFPSEEADILLKAFEVLDKDSKGFLTADELRQVRQSTLPGP